jgi:hypothetical protein
MTYSFMGRHSYKSTAKLRIILQFYSGAIYKRLLKLTGTFLRIRRVLSQNKFRNKIDHINKTSVA